MKSRLSDIKRDAYRKLNSTTHFWEVKFNLNKTLTSLGRIILIFLYVIVYLNDYKTINKSLTKEIVCLLFYGWNIFHCFVEQYGRDLNFLERQSKDLLMLLWKYEFILLFNDLKRIKHDRSKNFTIKVILIANILIF